jgi:hypothetical protein
MLNYTHNVIQSNLVLNALSRKKLTARSLSKHLAALPGVGDRRTSREANGYVEFPCDV